MPSRISLDFKEVKGNINIKSTTIYFVKIVLVVAFIFVMVVAVSMVVALFLQMGNLHEINRTLKRN